MGRFVLRATASVALGLCVLVPSTPGASETKPVAEPKPQEGRPRSPPGASTLRGARKRPVVEVLKGPLVVREQPSSSARSLGTIAAGAFVERSERTEAPPGWVRLTPRGFVSLEEGLVRLAEDIPRAAQIVHLDYARAEATSSLAREILTSAGVRLSSLPPLRRRSYFRLVEKVEYGGRAWARTSDGTLLPETSLAILTPSVHSGKTHPDSPAGTARVTPENCSRLFGACPARLLEVAADQGRLFAFERGQLRFSTRVSIGRSGAEELGGRQRVSPGKTPLGVFTILAKHRSLTMTSSGSSVLHQDVPWTMHFWGPYALHGAYWHDSFGTPMSGGCVNVSPRDGEFLFDWTTPTLPPGWHSVAARTTGEDSTTLWIHR